MAISYNTNTIGILTFGQSVRTCTWATRPTSPAIGDRIILTDHRNNVCTWNGTHWVPQGLWARGATRQQVNTVAAGTASLASVVIPGGMLGLNGQMRIRYRFAHTNSVNNKTMSVNLGGTNLFTATRTSTAAEVSEILIGNRGAQASQVELTNTGAGGVSDASSSNAAVPVWTVDTSLDQTLAFTGSVTLDTEFVALEAYSIEIFPG